MSVVLDARGKLIHLQQGLEHPIFLLSDYLAGAKSHNLLSDYLAGAKSHNQSKEKTENSKTAIYVPVNPNSLHLLIDYAECWIMSETDAKAQKLLDGFNNQFITNPQVLFAAHKLQMEKIFDLDNYEPDEPERWTLDNETSERILQLMDVNMQGYWEFPQAVAIIATMLQKSFPDLKISIKFGNFSSEESRQKYTLLTRTGPTLFAPYSVTITNAFENEQFEIVLGNYTVKNPPPHRRYETTQKSVDYASGSEIIMKIKRSLYRFEIVSKRIEKFLDTLIRGLEVYSNTELRIMSSFKDTPGITEEDLTASQTSKTYRRLRL